jgi:hypothetical protein
MKRTQRFVQNLKGLLGFKEIKEKRIAKPKLHSLTLLFEAFQPLHFLRVFVMVSAPQTIC